VEVLGALDDLIGMDAPDGFGSTGHSESVGVEVLAGEEEDVIASVTADHAGCQVHRACHGFFLGQSRTLVGRVMPVSQRQ
jgi:hypothetical protein